MRCSSQGIRRRRHWQCALVVLVVMFWRPAFYSDLSPALGPYVAPRRRLASGCRLGRSAARIPKQGRYLMSVPARLFGLRVQTVAVVPRIDHLYPALVHVVRADDNPIGYWRLSRPGAAASTVDGAVVAPQHFCRHVGQCNEGAFVGVVERLHNPRIALRIA